MNRHFTDAAYYLKRAGEHFRAGVQEEVEPVAERTRERLTPVEDRVRTVVGEDDDEESEPEAETRFGRVREEFREAEGRARKRVTELRSRPPLTR